TVQAYHALDAAHRRELTIRIGDLTERLRARLVPYSATDPARADIALQCAVTAQHANAFLGGTLWDWHEERPYPGVNIRDAAMADNVEWILGREERIVIGAATGHVQRWPFRVPPFVAEDQIMLGQHLARTHGETMVVIATTFNGGRMFLHRPVPDAPP